MPLSHERTLREKLTAYLASQCTGCDDHDSENCAKCAEMENSLLPIIREHAAGVAEAAEIDENGSYSTKLNIIDALKVMP